jgi:putative photosynthetic complex assembly protein 2
VIEYLAPAGIALLSWWLSTGLVLYLDGLPRATFRWSLAIATLIACGALVALYSSAHDASVASAYVAFAGALIVWGWHELTFLTGAITGPRKSANERPASRWLQARHATETLIYHELAIAATVLGVVGLTWGQPNQFGTWTFIALWLMRLSSKFNLFLGARNLGAEFLPDHLRYLSSFMRQRSMNPLFPFSLLAGGSATGYAVYKAIDPLASEHAVAGYTLIAILLGLGVLEHLFLMLPISITNLWRWGLRSHAATRAQTSSVG